MYDILRFDPKIMNRDILRRNTRKSISSWLRTKPKTLSGDPVFAIHHVMQCKPVNADIQDEQTNQILSFEDLSVSLANIAPAVKHSRGIGDLWSGEATDYHMLGFRDPHFMLWHDETYLRLLNSDLMMITAPQGSRVHFYHFAYGSLMLSEALIRSLPCESREGETWRGALMTAILPEPHSQHVRLNQVADVVKMNQLLSDIFYHTSENFEDILPNNIRLN